MASSSSSSTMEEDFSLLGLETHFNPSGWGPRTGMSSGIVGNIPYAHFDKKERIWRAADFSLQGQAYNAKVASFQQSRFRRDEQHGPQNADFTYKHDSVEDSSFQLVDTSKSQNKRYAAGILSVYIFIYMSLVLIDPCPQIIVFY